MVQLHDCLHWLPTQSCRSNAALKADTTHQEDFVLPYVNDLRNVVDIDAIRGSGLKLAVEPLGGAAVHYWEPINSIYELDIEVVNPQVDPTFAFMTVDHDGQIRMDCSSPYAMARHPNHYLAVAIGYLLTHRQHWPVHAAIGKTLVSSSMVKEAECVHEASGSVEDGYRMKQ